MYSVVDWATFITMHSGNLIAISHERTSITESQQKQSSQLKILIFYICNAIYFCVSRKIQFE